MLPSSVAMGIPGVEFAPGDHVCVFYPSLAERDEILIPYLRAGMAAGDKCVCVVDSDEPAAVLAAFSPDVDRQQSGLGLEVLRSQDTYFSGGSFSSDAMLSFWDRTMSGALSEGFTFARIAGEMTWALRQLPGVSELVEYEARLNLLLPQYPQVALCFYELDVFSGELLVDVLKTHPKVLIGGMVLDNPYYLAPDEFLAMRS